MTALWPPPVPREHGAWAMLYAPLLLGLLAAPPPAILTPLLLAAAITAAYLGQHAASLLLRRRGAQATGLWLGAYGALAIAAAVWLIAGEGYVVLLWLGIPACLLLGWQAWRRRSTRRHIERSHRAQFLTVAVLAFSAPAAVATSGGETGLAVLSWAAAAAFFWGSVLYVKMRVRGAGRSYREGSGRWRLGWPTGLYHLALLIAPLTWGAPGPMAAGLWALAVAPAATRAVVGWRAVGRGPLSLLHTGLVELACAAWYTAAAGMALRRLTTTLFRG